MVVRIGPDDFPLGKSTEEQEFYQQQHPEDDVRKSIV
jgi:hypothetical protein